jgi:BirA family biotin operon repressor/biotin-[acetyl-CoA-carboxylase] ligase
VLQSYGIAPQIKWPNDLFLGDKKLGGVLTETSLQKEMFDVFAGIGVNVNMEREALQNISQSATSLKIETGKNWERKELLQKLQRQFEKDLDLFRKEGFSPFHAYCDALLAYKDELVRCFNGKQEWIGICRSLSSDGKLNLELADHSMHTLITGEMSLRKRNHS